MKRKYNLLLPLVLALLTTSTTYLCNAYNIKTELIKPNKLIISLNLDKKEVLYNNFNLTTQNPQISLKKLDTQGNLTNYSNSENSKKEEAYTDEVKFTYEMTKENSIANNSTPLELLASFKISKKNKEENTPKNIQEIITVNTDFLNNSSNNTDTANKDIHNSPISESPKQIAKSSDITSNKNQTLETIKSCAVRFTKYWKDTLTSLFKTTGSAWIRYIAIFSIGILLSLTPCIYPMIPITVGIIQSTGSSSFFRNFFVSLSYTLGVSTTFALLGFVVALSRCGFGEITHSPWFIIPLIIVLTYLGLSMFGLYDMYIPRFLQPKGTKIKKGSAISAFIFGAISGTVASPCLSPGLVLALAYVAEISKVGNIMGYIEGFTLLFVFGIGASMPLLIIGTFSNSLKVLPTAGQWMVEVKRFLGLMLLGMCFYYLQMILPLFIILWLLAGGIFMLGVFYFWSVKPYDSKAMKYYKNIMGFVCVLIFFFVAIKAYKATWEYFYPKPITKDHTASKLNWLKNLDEAIEQAKKENKYLFIDFYGDFCSACHELDKNVLSKDIVEQVLNKHYIALKVNGSDKSNDAYDTLKQYIHILGFPTIVIFNPEDNSIVKEWASPDFAPEELAQILEKNRKL